MPVLYPFDRASVGRGGKGPGGTRSALPPRERRPGSRGAPARPGRTGRRTRGRRGRGRGRGASARPGPPSPSPPGGCGTRSRSAHEPLPPGGPGGSRGASLQRRAPDQQAGHDAFLRSSGRAIARLAGRIRPHCCARVPIAGRSCFDRRFRTRPGTSSRACGGRTAARRHPPVFRRVRERRSCSVGEVMAVGCASCPTDRLQVLVLFRPCSWEWAAAATSRRLRDRRPNGASGGFRDEAQRVRQSGAARLCQAP